jgi:hypothetical protein
MSQADSPTTTIRPAAPADAAVSPVDTATSKRIVGVLAAFAPHRIPVSGADADDIEHCAKQVAYILDIAYALVDDLNKNLSSCGVDPSPIADLKGDLMGQMTTAAEQWIEENSQFGMGA